MGVNQEAENAYSTGTPGSNPVLPLFCHIVVMFIYILFMQWEITGPYHTLLVLNFIYISLKLVNTSAPVMYDNLHGKSHVLSNGKV